MIRKVLYAVIFLLGAYFIVKHFDELKLILVTIQHSDGRWLLVAVLAHLLWLVTIGATFKACYHVVGVDERLSRMVPLTTAANFLNVVAPSYGAGALAVLLYDGNQQGKPAGKVSSAAYLYLLFDYLGVMVLVLIGFGILARRGLLSTIIIGAAAFIGAIAAGLLAITLMAIFANDLMTRTILGIVRLVNRMAQPLLHRDVFSLAKAGRFAADIADGLGALRHAPWRLLPPAMLALSRKAAMLIILFLVSVAFHHPFDLPTLLGTFTVGYLFTIASITPSGVGFVEGAMALMQTALGVDPATSAGIAIAYRGITFWLTLLYGFPAIRWVGYKPGKTPERVDVSLSQIQPRLGRPPWRHPVRSVSPGVDPHRQIHSSKD